MPGAKPTSSGSQDLARKTAAHTEQALRVAGIGIRQRLLGREVEDGGVQHHADVRADNLRAAPAKKSGVTRQPCLGTAVDLTYGSREGARLAEVLLGRALVEAVALDAQPHEVQVDRRGGDEGRRFKRRVLACAERDARSLLSVLRESERMFGGLRAPGRQMSRTGRMTAVT